MDERTRNSKQIVARMVDALNDHVIEGQEEFWHEDMHWYGPAGIGAKMSLKAFQDEHQRPFLHAFPDKVAHDQVQIAEGDYVASFGYQEATHAGDYLGIPATGKKVKVRYMDFWRVEDGKLKENWVMIDLLDFLEQLDVDVEALLADAMKYRRGSAETRSAREEAS
ncbi:MAG: ester cyclase [Trueperaceae bacterium]|nr:MAG: ester cyclase [Trueperaceae bacterium]